MARDKTGSSTGGESLITEGMQGKERVSVKIHTLSVVSGEGGRERRRREERGREKGRSKECLPSLLGVAWEVSTILEG